MVREKSWVACIRRSLIVLFAAAIVLSLPLGAQTFRGSILGSVSDPSGAAIAGASVTAKNNATGILRTTQTTSDGSYSIPELPVGTYEVTATMTGFQTAVATGVSVEVARDRRVDFTLKPGSISQRVEVKEEAGVPIETTTNNLGGSFQSTDIVNLPVNGRDIDKLYIMAPGVTGDPSGAGGAPGSYGQFSANGNRDRANNFLLDGTDMNDSYRNLPAINQGAVFAIPGTILPVETIAEVRILTNYDAEYGRSSGAVINIVTKSGTNEIHGSAFEYFRNSVLNARNFFNTVGPKDAFRNNQFGGAFGGPIQKSKTFYYVGYEGQREGLGLSSLNTVPTLNNTVSGTPGTDYAQAIGNLGGNSAACTTTVIACIDNNAAVVNPVIKNFYDLCAKNGHCSGGTSPWPAANITPVNGFNNVGSDPGHNNVDSMIVKIDHTFNASNTLSGRYFYGQSGQSLPLGTGGGNNIPNTNTFSPTDVNLVSISLVSTISPTQTNEARFGYNRYHEGFYAQDRNVFGDPNASIGLNTCLGTVVGTTVNTCGPTGTGAANSRDFGLPVFAFSNGLSSLGSSRFANPRNRFDRNYQFVDNFSWKFSKNDVKMGFEYRHTSVDSVQDLNFRGKLRFDDLSAFLSGADQTFPGCFSCYINYGTSDRFTTQNSFATFIQDSWQILPRLTVNAGIRWDFYGVIMEGLDGISSYNPLSTGFGLSPAHQPYPNDRNNFAPRVSLAWDPFGKGKTVVRAGAAVFYDTFSFDYFTGQLFENTNNGGPAYNAIGTNPIFQGGAVGGPLAVGVPVFDTTSIPCTTAASLCSAPVSGTLNFDTFDASTVGRLRTPYVYNFTLNLQQELTTNTVLQVGYIGTQGRRLQRIVDLNQPSQAAITAYDATCVGGLGISLTNCALGTTLPPNFNNFAPFLLPGQIDNAAIMSPQDPQTPFYLQQLQTTARSSYNSLVVSLSQRNWHGLTQQIAYTWSHSLDDASDGQDYVPHAGQPNDSTNPHGSSYGNSNFDTRNHFVWALDYAFPKAKGLGKFGEGWSISSVVSAMTGHPVELVNALDNYDGSGEFFGRPDIIGPIRYNFSNPTQWLDLSSFAVQCTLDGVGTAAANCLSGTRHFGTLGRNALLGPPFRQWDLALVKNTKLTERYTLQLRADFFNILNHPNFSNPLLPSFFDDVSGFASPDINGRFRCPAGSPACGTPGSQFFPITATVDTGIGNPILGGGGPRSIQLSARITF
jgi:hypothetical protein